VIHYELILFYAIGFTPSDAIKRLGCSRSSAYRMHTVYRRAGQRLGEQLFRDKSVSLGGKYRATNPGEGRKIKGRPRREKKMCLVKNGKGGYDEVWL